MSSPNPEKNTLQQLETIETTATIGAFLSAVPYLLTYFIQNNVYGRENLLKGVSEFLNDQTFATSYFGILLVMTLSLYAESALKNKLFLKYPLVPSVVILLANTLYEINQSYHPKYVDNNLMDGMMGGCAFLTISIVYMMVKSVEDSEELNQ